MYFKPIIPLNKDGIIGFFIVLNIGKQISIHLLQLIRNPTVIN